MDPLHIYIYPENMVRFSTNKYCHPSPSNLSDHYCHFTNYSIIKNSSKFIEDQGEKDEFCAHKRATTSFFAEFEDIGVDTEAIQ